LFGETTFGRMNKRGSGTKGNDMGDGRGPLRCRNGFLTKRWWFEAGVIFRPTCDAEPERIPAV
jgi:hypothetical protein